VNERVELVWVPAGAAQPHLAWDIEFKEEDHRVRTGQSGDGGDAAEALTAVTGFHFMLRTRDQDYQDFGLAVRWYTGLSCWSGGMGW
jgi:hypothetical protein